ncbi:MAG: 4-(cytidine 5'-diphospho)-2-C-methyl-D-erythritol kinase [Alphaproteobacteria bacterium]
MATAAEAEPAAPRPSIGPRPAGPWRFGRAPAKVNLGLRVTGRRGDGYHLLDSLAVFAGAGDCVAVRPVADGSTETTLSLRGPFAGALAGQPMGDNLAVRAAESFRQAFGGPAVDIVLWKHLPVASGIGGGTADAAAVIRLLADMARIAPHAPPLLALALALGADGPMCLAGRTARVSGVGEALGPAPAMPPLPAVLVNPGVPISTPDAFRGRTGPFSPIASLAEAYPDVRSVAAAVEAFGNDLTPAAAALAPAVADVLDALNGSAGAACAGMSGSGATCFALFPDAAAARQAARTLARPGWWARATTLNG